jgi:signal transduction histidine kinase
MANPAVNILLVDDEVRNLEVLESVLESPDYRLVRAHTAQEALLLLIDGEFAAIVLDINMPGMTGIELANLIKQRKRTQHIPVIFLTAYFQEDKDVLEGYEIGAVDYLTKPINSQILKSKIGVFVDLFRKTRALAATNAALELEITQRQNAEDALRVVNNELETRVQERTADLVRVNEELRQREIALRVSEAQAKAASRAKDDFLAALSHELRTPLNPVLLLATEAASDRRLPPNVRANFEMIAKNVTLEARLIDDLLDLTRITHGKLAIEMQPFNVHTGLREVLAMANEEMNQKGIVLTLSLDAPHCMVSGDDVRLKQVFWNVIKNAIKFTPERGQIAVETMPAMGIDEQLEIKVTDTGIGMTPAELERVFEAFCQGDHTMEDGTHRFGGIGLGLAISRMLVKLHEGSISAKSDGRGKGTMISILLPLLRPSAKVPEAAKHAPAATPDAFVPHTAERQRRILLVEDHPSTVDALTQLLVRRKYEVVVAKCLAEARELYRREKFDLLISDIGLPDGNGYELMSELRGSNGLVGIALTGYGMEEDVDRSRKAGFFMQLTKPVSIQALDSALAAASRTACAH